MGMVPYQYCPDPANSHPEMGIIVSCIVGIFACLGECVMAIIGTIADCLECIIGGASHKRHAFCHLGNFLMEAGQR